MSKASDGRGPYHEGELAVQQRVGVTKMAAKIARGIHDEIVPGAADFLAERSFVVVASRDGNGRIWASLLTGAPGFVDAPDEHTLIVQAAPSANDPLRESLEPGAPIGMIAIDFATRRRFRINGTVETATERGFVLQVAQAYGNCPKYIQRRDLPPGATAPPSKVREVARGEALSDAQRAWIAGADTFFVATAHPERGADASHRGGNPGFVRVADASRLVWPDYSGNTMFQTLGNLAVSPSAGLLFFDFARGAVLQLTGDARVVWDEDEARRVPGAERLVEFTVALAIETEGELPLGWRGFEASPYNPR